MIGLLLLVLLIVLSAVVLLMPLLFGMNVYRRRSGPRHVTCPETKKVVDVTIDAAHSAATALSGTEYMRLAACTRWPERKDCDQDCVYELMTEEREQLPGRPRMAHVPVVVGAALAWFLGAVWYAPPLFGRTWMRLQGLDHDAAHWRAETVFPYLIVLAGFFVLGYTVEWLVVRSGKSGICRGAAMGALFSLFYVAAELGARHVLSGPRMPFTWVEAAYLVAGGTLCGAIVSGWPRLQSALTFS